ncbi:Hypothetical_protein [Hexamita inflata]|uniref:Hypothetical_protein n=1 Tax=Hexamita inflata TaxID=28002 RepID=A0AA86QD51_9EUKA|nr:Hypothetical protein HINF_LOCUS44734 [Hexamita inflata]
MKKKCKNFRKITKNLRFTSKNLLQFMTKIKIAIISTISILKKLCENARCIIMVISIKTYQNILCFKSEKNKDHYRPVYDTMYLLCYILKQNRTQFEDDIIKLINLQIFQNLE